MIELLVDGQRYTDFERVELFRSIEACAGLFAVVGPSGRGPLTPGQRVQLIETGEGGTRTDLLLTGNVERIDLDLSDELGEMRAGGRDLTGDLIDASAQVDGGELRDVTLLQIAQLAAVPLAIDVDVAPGADLGDPFARFGIEPGEGAWEVIERACRARGVLAIPSSTGALLLASPGSSRAAVDLVQGVNVQRAHLTRDDGNRHRFYVVRAQRRGDDLDYGYAVARCAGSAEDLGARPGRLLIIRSESSLDTAGCIRRAQWEATTRAARALTVTIDHVGLREFGDTGPVWDVNRLVRVRLPAFGIDADLLVSGVRLSSASDRSGRTAELTLTRADAWRPDVTVGAADGFEFGEALDDEVGL